MNNYRHSSKRECDTTKPVASMSCHFPVGNAKLLELYTKNAEFTIWFDIELPGLWEESAAAKPWFKNAVGKMLRTRRRLQPEDTAVLLLEIPLHDASDTEFTQKMIASIKTIVDELQIFVKNVLIVLMPGDEEGGRCYVDFNNKLRLALETQQCRLTPTFEEEREGAIESERWPARNNHGVWTSTETETYLQVVLRAEAQRRGRVYYDQRTKRARTQSIESPRSADR